MKVREVLKDLIRQDLLKEIHIISHDRVVYTGSALKWFSIGKPWLIKHKRRINNSTVINWIVFDHSKAFIFIDKVAEE